MSAAELVAGLLSGAAAEPRLPERYRLITAQQELCQQAADAMTAPRAAILAQMSAAGMSYAQIASTVGLSRARVQQLVEMGRDTPAIAYDDEIREAVLTDAAWWILRYRAAGDERTHVQAAARVRRDLAEFTGVPAGEAGQLAREAMAKAARIQDTVPGWDQRALGS
jgi:transcriptional regulator with XRE-family HTH domain